MSQAQEGGLEAKVAVFSEQRRPNVAAALNGQEGEVIKVQGVFP